MPSFQVLSDLHLEKYSRYGRFKITATAPYLALLGDIGCVQQDAQKGIFRGMLLRLLSQYKAIIYVPGNHEPHNTTWPAVMEWLRTLAKDVDSLRKQGEHIGQFIPLNRGRYDIEEGGRCVTILGCTLFSWIPPNKKKAVSEQIKDFRKIKGTEKGSRWTVDDHLEEFCKSVCWLNAEVQKAEAEGREVAIFSHHSPTTDDRAVEEKYRGDELTSAYSTDLSAHRCWKSRTVKLWAFGHTHYNCDYVDEFGKRIFTNQKGYVMVGDSKGYDPAKVVEF
ncbi:Metallo-dependent phosphatase-like protein [Podospora aff. communis PSN243]|uniref:Metallo-dependent phosphatase-like protein n=1 Tax=Podospora aff. communis PSN243 TaxID=3040156 RepID=A0AAV9GF24_9PEZI|nr:Metallo-dependent phosphatase-like protein [Podospora aff. communis PSN243]